MPKLSCWRKPGEPPVNLDLFAFRFPITAIASISHRISGFILFLLLPLVLFALDQSLVSNESFRSLSHALAPSWCRFSMWVLLSAVTYHLLSAFRHALMEMGCAETLAAGRATAWAVFAISAVVIVGWGVMLW